MNKAINLALEVRKSFFQEKKICVGLLNDLTVAAEYLAKGYILSDHILERAIEMDSRLTFSCRYRNIADDYETR